MTDVSEPPFRADHVGSLLRPRNCCGRGRSIMWGGYRPRRSNSSLPAECVFGIILADRPRRRFA